MYNRVKTGHMLCLCTVNSTLGPMPKVYKDWSVEPFQSNLMGRLQ